MSEYKFEVFSRRGLRGKRWYFRFVAPNGQIMAQSEGYVRKIDALSAVSSIQANAPSAQIKHVSL